MIQKTELKINNIVIIDNEKHRPTDTGKEAIIISIQEDAAGVQLLEDNYGVNTFGQFYKYLKPIPLTEIWLEKLGLIKKNITEDMLEEFKQPDIDEDGSIWYHWVQGLFNLEIQSNGEIWFELYSHYKHIKYVHELQNLYYSLAGVELSVS